MPEIHPFKGLHYDPAKVGDLSRVMTQPYDKIDDVLREEYYRRHPHSFIRIDKRKDEPGDATGLEKYGAAADELAKWQREGVLVRDPKPALYLYHQTYRTPEGAPGTRKGLSAMVKLEELGRGRIHPHEETHSGPKIDRRRLLEATRTHLSQVFLLYSDPGTRVDRLLDPATSRRPDLEATDDFGDGHKIWRIEDPAAISKVQADLAGRDAIIADGHHRYETAWGYSKDHPEADKVLATLVNMDDEGLTILGTHRLIRDLADFNADRLLGRLKEAFQVKAFPASARTELLAALKAGWDRVASFGLVLAGRDPLYLLEAKGNERVPDREVWRTLDVSILHGSILEPMLGITPGHTAREQFVEYVRSADEAIDKVRGGGPYQAAFLVNPVRLGQIKAITVSSRRFPQKSTDFFPKLLSGLVMCSVNSTGA